MNIKHLICTLWFIFFNSNINMKIKNNEVKTIKGFLTYNLKYLFHCMISSQYS
jgi:hypothetical protein